MGDSNRGSGDECDSRAMDNLLLQALIMDIAFEGTLRVKLTNFE
jgi:hypothetical protein